MTWVRAAAVIAVVVSLLAAMAVAAELDSVVVTHDSGRYALDADARLAAPREAIFVILTDYDRFGRISSAYKEYRFLDPAPDGTPMIYTRMEGCVLIFCKSLGRTEYLYMTAPGHIRSVAVPEQSDFHHSVSEWHLEPDGDGTRVLYHLEMEPKFWVPPIIGPWILQRRLSRGGVAAVNRIELLAQQLAPEIAKR